MLKFFRKIRRRLLGSGKIRSYALYAIGEILLVVIGILIALEINNWNQNNQNSREEKRILQDLSEELQFNMFLNKRGSETMGEVLGAAERLLDAISNSSAKSPPSKEQIDLDIHKLTWVWMSGRPTTIYDVLRGCFT